MSALLMKKRTMLEKLLAPCALLLLAVGVSVAAWAADPPAAVPTDVPAAAPASSAPAAAASAPADAAPAPTPTPAVSASAPDAAASAAANTPEPAPEPTPALDAKVQALKAEVIALNRDLLVLEEELLFPAGTQVALFLSMDVGKLFDLESVQIKLNDKVVTNYLYTPLEVQALHRGGVQRVFVGNLRTGKHVITAFFTGKGPKTGEFQRDYKRGTTLEFEKGTEPRYIELRIRDQQSKQQPEFEVKVWQ
jgi:hypothetical protein